MRVQGRRTRQENKSLAKRATQGSLADGKAQRSCGDALAGHWHDRKGHRFAPSPHHVVFCTHHGGMARPSLHGHSCRVSPLGMHSCVPGTRHVRPEHLAVGYLKNARRSQLAASSRDSESKSSTLRYSDPQNPDFSTPKLGASLGSIWVSELEYASRLSIFEPEHPASLREREIIHHDCSAGAISSTRESREVGRSDAPRQDDPAIQTDHTRACICMMHGERTRGIGGTERYGGADDIRVLGVLTYALDVDGAARRSSRNRVNTLRKEARREARRENTCVRTSAAH